MKFLYSTIKSAREFGIKEFQTNDTKLISLIEFYSKMCNRMIEKTFAPSRELIRFDGTGNRFLRVEGKSDIIKINSISIIYSDGSRTLLDASKYTYQGGTIINDFIFPIGRKNIEMDAVFGTLENKKDVEVEILTDIDQFSESVKVNSAANLDPRDVLIFDKRMIIINDIDYEENTLMIDIQYDKKTIGAGSRTTCYGAVPLEIERAINLLVKHNKALENQVGGIIRREKTDNYEYEMFQNHSYSTGIPEVDRIFHSFLDDNFIIEYL